MFDDSYPKPKINLFLKYLAYASSKVKFEYFEYKPRSFKRYSNARNAIINEDYSENIEKGYELTEKRKEYLEAKIRMKFSKNKYAPFENRLKVIKNKIEDLGDRKKITKKKLRDLRVKISRCDKLIKRLEEIHLNVSSH